MALNEYNILRPEMRSHAEPGWARQGTLPNCSFDCDPLDRQGGYSKAGNSRGTMAGNSRGTMAGKLMETPDSLKQMEVGKSWKIIENHRMGTVQACLITGG